MIPKFRAWDKEESIIRTVSALSFEHEKVFCKFAEFEPFDLGEELPFERIVLMQSTGLKDKNDLEIFEGDIIGRTDRVSHDWRVSLHQVVWYDTGFSGKQIGSGCHIGLDYWTQRKDGYVVLGNIYENPELLEVEE